MEPTRTFSVKSHFFFDTLSPTQICIIGIGVADFYTE